jgi:uncharacterized membrane protein YedE/YeeE
MTERDEKAWNPYVAGALAGLLMVLSIWITGKYVGASTTFVRTAGMIEQVFGAERVAQMEYYLKDKPVVDWQWMFVIGIFAGSLLSAVTSGTFRLTAVPDRWERRFGKSPVKRGLVAFAGGIVAMYGARLADG